jgi:gliding motility-associated-like protein
MLSTNFMAMAQFPMPDNVCIGAIKHYYVDPDPVPGSIYIWKIDGVTQVSFTTNEIDISWTITNTYLLEVQEVSKDGCFGPSKSGQVFVNPSPTPFAGVDRTIYLNQSTQIGMTAINGSTYSWSSVPVGFSSTEANPSVTPMVSTIYSVVETISGTGCQATNSVRITVISHNIPPVATDDYDTTRVNTPIVINILKNDFDPDGRIVHIALCGGPYNGLVALNSDSTIIYSPTDGFIGIDSLCYFICDNNVPVLCDTASVYFFVIGRSYVHQLTIYNVITPNGDGLNDNWIIGGIEEFPNNSVIIFNRWGDKINSYDRYDNNTVVWNGTNSKGKLVPDGTYYYILTIKDMETLTGWVLIRGSLN